MNIAFFTDSYLPIRDGVSSVVNGLARSLVRAGHSVRVFAPNPEKGAPKEREFEDGVTVVRSRSIPVPYYGEYKWSVLPWADLWGEGLRRDIDVMHLHSPGTIGTTGFFAARSYGKPLVGTFHTDVWAMRKSFPERWPVRVFFRVASFYNLGLYFRCDAATVPTPAAKAALLKRARKQFRRPVEVIPNGIEVDRFHPGVARPDWRTRCGLPPAPLAVHLGRLTSDKGVYRFLDAVESARAKTDFVAIVGGVGPEEVGVRARIEQSPLLSRSVRYVGPVAEEEKAALLAQSELFVLPSIADTSSIALLEAMACGSVPIVSPVGGPAQIVSNGRTGRVVPLDPPELLGQVLVELVEENRQRQEFSRNAVELVRRTASIDLTARRFISLYELLLEERGAHARRNV